MTYWDGSSDWERGTPGTPGKEPYVPPQDWTGGPDIFEGEPRESWRGPDGFAKRGPEWVNGPEPVTERERAWEEAPLSLTAAQKSRVWRILSQECGHVLAFRILTRIETEA